MEGSTRYALVRPDAMLAKRGLHVMVGGPEAAPGVPQHGKGAEVSERVAGFLAYAESIGLDFTRQVIARVGGVGESSEGGPIAGMCLWVPAPGRTAMLFCPSQSEFPETANATTAAIVAALDDARQGGVVLVQAMLEPADAAGKTVFAAGGLTQLATLTYMERKPPVHVPPPVELPNGYTLEPYSASTHRFFCDAILQSYEQTLDCPALSGVREIEDIVAGHKGAGVFDPQLWSLLLRYGKPAGCLLLAEIPTRQTLELVYLGLVAAARGQGLGRLLMQRVLTIAARRHFAAATLAVDAANAPAIHLYRRCGYTSVAQRVAMIRRLA